MLTNGPVDFMHTETLGQAGHHLHMTYQYHQIIIAHATEHESPVLKACFIVNQEAQLQINKQSFW